MSTYSVKVRTQDGKTYQGTGPASSVNAAYEAAVKRFGYLCNVLVVAK